MQMILAVLSGLTFAYMTLCFVTDIRNRFIYAFPCMILMVFWTAMGLMTTHRVGLIAVIFSVHMAAYLTFKITGMWGDGDSDVFFLYGMLFMTSAISGGYDLSITAYFTAELIGIIIALLLSFVIGFIEAAIRKKKITKTSSIAVVPGFSIVMAALLIKMILAR